MFDVPLPAGEALPFLDQPADEAGGEPGGCWVFFGLFWSILLYFRPSGMLPIDSSRRELQNAIGEIKIGDFCTFFMKKINFHDFG